MDQVDSSFWSNLYEALNVYYSVRAAPKNSIKIALSKGSYFQMKKKSRHEIKIWNPFFL